jgi:Cys-tRNA(Pro)/Cys-tRNA(Cys) deacylase
LKGGKTQKTNAVRLLESLGAPFKLIETDLGDDFHSAKEISEYLSLPEEMVYKTLLLRGDKTGLLEAMVPASKDLDLKALALLSQNKKTVLTPLKDLFPLTGYLRGGCSPLGGKHDYPLFLSENALLLDNILFNAGKRGLFLLMTPEDLIKITGAVTGPLELAGGGER